VKFLLDTYVYLWRLIAQALAEALMVVTHDHVSYLYAVPFLAA
jgi:hypothetical protein